MSQAARWELRALGHCDGARPWLGAGTKESCGENNRLLIRSASNAYFPQLMSVISIPDMRSALDEVIRSLWDDFLSDVETPEELAKVRKKPTPAVKLSPSAICGAVRSPMPALPSSASSASRAAHWRAAGCRG